MLLWFLYCHLILDSPRVPCGLCDVYSKEQIPFCRLSSTVCTAEREYLYLWWIVGDVFLFLCDLMNKDWKKKPTKSEITFCCLPWASRLTSIASTTVNNKMGKFLSVCELPSTTKSSNKENVQKVIVKNSFWNNLSTCLSTDCWPFVGRQVLAKRQTNSLLIVGQQLANCRWSVSNMSVSCR